MKTSQERNVAIIDLFGGWAILLCLSIGCDCFAATGDDRIAPLLTSPPRVVAMPEEYCKTWQSEGEDYFGFGDVIVLQDGQWAVAEIMHYDNPKTLVGGPCGTFAGRSISVGWLAIELRTGKSIYLQPPRSRQMPKDVKLGRAGFHDRLCNWQTGSCAIGVQVVSEDRVKNATPESRIKKLGIQAIYTEDERWFLWKWCPEKGLIKPLDWFAPVNQLVGVLDNTPYTVLSWKPPFKGSGWSGQIHLQNNKTRKDLVLELPNVKDPITPNDSFLSQADARLDFGPTDNHHTIVVADRYGLDRDSSVLSLIDLADNFRVRWQLDRKAIEKILGGRVKTFRLIHGPQRPCRYLPMILLGGNEKCGLDRPLWILDSKTGNLAGPQSLPWKFNGTLFKFSSEGLTLCASHNGHLLVYYTDDSLDSEPAQIVVYDITNRKIIASREPTSPDTKPVEFDAIGNVILANSIQILRWPAPFASDWKVIFSLAGKKTQDTTGESGRK